jgi:hypothetical protein
MEGGYIDIVFARIIEPRIRGWEFARQGKRKRSGSVAKYD